MKRSRKVFEQETLEDLSISPKRKKLKLTDQSSLETKTSIATTNGNNTEFKKEEEEEIDVAFWLTKSAWIQNNEYNKYSLSLDDIIKTSSSTSIISKCLIFNFKIDIEWIFGICPILKNNSKVENIEIYHGESIDTHYNLCNYMLIYKHLRLFKIKMPYSYGTHHTKMIILLYKNEGIRIVISTANMIQKDWCHKTNAIYLQDFPLKNNSDNSDNNKNDFERILIDYCNKLHGLNNQKINNFSFLRNYDYNSSKILLIPSVPGYHKNEYLNYYGHKRLNYVLKSNNNIDINNDNLIVNVSSIGSLTEEWIINEFYRINNNKFKLLWPTVEDVRNSIEGYSAGGSLCFSNKNNKLFLKKYFYKWNASISGRNQLMPHIKSYLSINNNNNKLKFFLLTSANLSTAAWGKLQKNNKQLFIRSFEMGCLYLKDYYINRYLKHKHKGFCLSDLPLKNMKRNLLLNGSGCGNNNNNNNNDDMKDVDFEIAYQLNKNDITCTNKRKIIFPIPMEVVNVQKYNNLKDKPWVWDLKYTKPDTHGLQWST